MKRILLFIGLVLAFDVASGLLLPRLSYDLMNFSYTENTNVKFVHDVKNWGIDQGISPNPYWEKEIENNPNLSVYIVIGQSKTSLATGSHFYAMKGAYYYNGKGTALEGENLVEKNMDLSQGLVELDRIESWFKTRGLDTFRTQYGFYGIEDCGPIIVNPTWRIRDYCYQITPFLLSLPKSRISEVVLHEGAHGAIKDQEGLVNVPLLSESMVTFIGIEGAKLYFAHAKGYGKNSKEYKEVLAREEYWKKFKNFVNKYYIKLWQIYDADIPEQQKLIEHDRILAQANQEFKTIFPEGFKVSDELVVVPVEVNNAFLGWYGTYTMYYDLAAQVYAKAGSLSGLVQVYKGIQYINYIPIWQYDYGRYYYDQLMAGLKHINSYLEK